MRKTIREQFYSKVLMPENLDDCWEWIGAKLRGGYGNLNINKRTYQAHRISYLLYFGEFDLELCVLHKCDNPSCVNPNHLFLGTRLDNMKDRNSKNRQANGDKGFHWKLRREEVNCIKQIHKIDNPSMRRIARAYKIAYSHINAILNNRVWKNENSYIVQ